MAKPKRGDDPLTDYHPGTPPTRPPAEVGSVNPVDDSAERVVLAGMLTSQQLFEDISEALSPDDFGVPAHRNIYAAIVQCDSTGKPFDPVTVADAMTSSGTLNASGGLDYLNSLTIHFDQPEYWGSHLEIVRDRSLRRRMLGAARLIGRSATDPGRAASEVLDDAEQAVFELGRANDSSGAPSMSQVVARVHAEMEAAGNSSLVGHSSGFGELDKLTGGFRGGQLVVIGARPGMGKSALALQIARHIAETSGKVVPFLSYEMTASELGFRLLSSATGIGLSELLRGYVPSGMDRVLAHEAEKMAELPLILNDQPPVRISAARSYVRRVARRAPVGAIFVDYLQLQTGDGVRRDENRTQEVSTISRTWKLVASELDVPVFAVAQLNRGLENRPNKRPILSDLRDSGSIEQDANMIAFLYNEARYRTDADETQTELIIAKNRQGPQATIPLDWDGPCVRFTSSTRALNTGGNTGGGFGGSWSASGLAP